MGSRKTALFLALAGKPTKSNEKFDRHYSSIVYAVQDSWIMNGTVKKIVMGRSPFDVNLYHDIINAVTFFSWKKKNVSGSFLDHPVIPSSDSPRLIKHQDQVYFFLFMKISYQAWLHLSHFNLFTSKLDEGTQPFTSFFSLGFKGTGLQIYNQ